MAWLTSISKLLLSAFSNEEEGIELPFHEFAQDMYKDINAIYEFLGLDAHNDDVNAGTFFLNNFPFYAQIGLHACPNNCKNKRIADMYRMYYWLIDQPNLGSGRPIQVATNVSERYCQLYKLPEGCA
jgi:hypothetical protein